MQLLVFRIVYLHTKNELPVNYETFWSRSTRVGRPCTYAQKFRNELFCKVKFYFSWNKSISFILFAQKSNLPVNYETIPPRSTRVGEPCTYAQKFRSELFTKVKFYFSWNY